MDTRDTIFTLVLAVITVVPVLGVTARFTLKPMVDAILRLREGQQGQAMLDARVLGLESEVRQLRDTVAALETTVDFQQKLLAGPPVATPIQPPALA
jgi:hypothetical protein